MKKLKLFTTFFMLCLQGMLACRSDDISPQKPSLNPSSARSQWENPHSSEDMTVKGIFTFLNGQKAIMYFDEKGEITSLTIDEDNDVSYEYDTANGYLEITKSKIVAYLHAYGQLKDYEYSIIPITRWYAYLNNGWSGVPYLDMPEQANTEGIGTFEMIYITTDKSVIDPIKPIRGLILGKSKMPLKKLRTNF